MRNSISEPEPEPKPELPEGVPPHARNVLEWLESVKLDVCHAALAELDYGEDLDMIKEGDDEEVDDIYTEGDASNRGPQQSHDQEVQA